MAKIHQGVWQQVVCLLIESTTRSFYAFLMNPLQKTLVQLDLKDIEFKLTNCERFVTVVYLIKIRTMKLKGHGYFGSEVKFNLLVILIREPRNPYFC